MLIGKRPSCFAGPWARTNPVLVGIQVLFFSRHPQGLTSQWLKYRWGR